MTAFKSKDEIKEGMLVRVIGQQNNVPRILLGEVGVAMTDDLGYGLLIVKFYKSRATDNFGRGWALSHFNLEKAFP